VTANKLNYTMSLFETICQPFIGTMYEHDVELLLQETLE
jgi:hypothetical protein